MNFYLLLLCFNFVLTSIIHQRNIRAFSSLTTKEKYKVQGLKLADDSIKDLGYAGNIDIRNNTANLFFWYFEAQNTLVKNPPLVIWLQGGPGASSMIGLFNMNGPIKLNQKNEIIKNKNNWNKDYSILYIDQPVGTGFSKINKNNAKDIDENKKCYNKEGYAHLQCGVGKDLVEFLVEFRKLFEITNNNSIYITGESYAGKFIPVFANELIQFNKIHKDNINEQFSLKGIAIGNGLTDPVSQIKVYGPLGLSMGLLTPKQSRYINELSSSAIVLTFQKKWEEAYNKREEIFEYYKKATYDVDYYDIRLGNKHLSWKQMEDYLNLKQSKLALNVDLSYNFTVKNSLVKEALKEDSMKSVVPLFKNFKDLKMLFFQGQFDYRDGAMSQYEWLYHEYPCLEKAKRVDWYVNNELAGYKTKCKKILHAIVLQAGHRVGHDQPERALDLIDQFIKE
ncbi:alpha/beta-hydrolase [Neoconidiobolus thromboides FSU 785]|nr:alpha/beta-hydrolase [Neoconidiobolus thromboides FSU 785]